MKKVIVIGAGNHAKVVIDILEEQNENIIGLLDDNVNNEYMLGYEVLGKISEFEKFKEDCFFIVSIGNNKIREKFYSILAKSKCKLISAIHECNSISKYAKLGKGLIINSGVSIHPDVTIGTGTIIGMNATISHDCYVGNYVHIDPGVHLTGEVQISDCVEIGTGAVVIPRKKIGRNTIIGAGSVIISDIPEYSVAVGVPAKVIRRLEEAK